MTQPAITVEEVTKTFRIYRDRAPSAKERIIRFGRNPHEVFKALDDVSFEIAQGETFALLGHNGSGKSTMLKCIAGTLRPNKGRITSRGRLAALLELGAGFHPDLTGRENIYLNGSILGFSARQIDTIFDDIVDFAELHDFIDNQVKHYSSGMFARLGFAVAINVEPEILLVDEVLSVGDESFQRKCINRVHDLQRDGRTILLVTHAAELVRQLAHRAAVLDHGKLVAVDEPDEAIGRFRETLARRGIALVEGQVEGQDQSPEAGAEAEQTEAAPQWSAPPSKEIDAELLAAVDHSSSAVAITKVTVELPDPTARFLLPGQPMRLRVDYVASEPVNDVAVAFELVAADDTIMTATDTQGLLQPIVDLDGVGAVCFDFDSVPYHDGRYSVNVRVSTRNLSEVLATANRAADFEVMTTGTQSGLVALNPQVVHFFHSSAVLAESNAESSG